MIQDGQHTATRHVPRSGVYRLAWLYTLPLAGTLAAGCAADRAYEPVAVSQAWHAGHADEQHATVTNPPAEPPLPNASPSNPVATVNDRLVSRDRLVELLLAGRGALVLDQLVALELARGEAEKRGVTVTAGEIEAEYDRGVQALLSSLPTAEPNDLDHEAAERLLDQVLAARGMSRQEYRLGVTRNAYLRKLAEARLQFTDDDLQEEYARTYGRRVRLRHIQLARLGDAELIRQRLEAGADFAELARQHSANTVTAPGGGLLEPFSHDDPQVPPILREAAFSLKPGEISNPIRVDNWYHILRVDEQLAAQDVPIESVRDELEQRLRSRQIGAEIGRVSAELYEAADIRVLDPVLRAGFLRQHPELNRSAR